MGATQFSASGVGEKQKEQLPAAGSAKFALNFNSLIIAFNFWLLLPLGILVRSKEHRIIVHVVAGQVAWLRLWSSSGASTRSLSLYKSLHAGQ